MAGPGGREVGRVSVKALPDTSRFAVSLERYLERLERTLHVEIPVELSSGDVAAAEMALDELARNRTAEINVDVDTSELGKLQRALKGTQGLEASPASLSGALSGTLAVLVATAAVLPVVSTLVLALPGLVTAVAAPIAAILVGLDGIKAAAQVLVEPFREMAAAVSGVFQVSLAGPFKELTKIFPTLTRGLSEIADSVSGIVADIVDGLTSDKGLALLASIMDQLSQALDIIGPSLTPLTEAFLTLINSGMKQFVEIAPALAGLTEQFAKFVEWADQVGILDDAFTFLGQVILGIIALFFGLVALGTIMAAQIQVAWDQVVAATTVAAGLIQTQVTFISDSFNAIPAGVEAAFGIVDGLFLGLPSRILAAVGDLSTVLFQAGKDLIQGFINGINDQVKNGLTGVLAEVGHKAVDAVTGVLGIHSPSTVFRDIGLDSMRGMVQGVELGKADVLNAFDTVAADAAGLSLAPLSFEPAVAAEQTSTSRRAALTITNWHAGTGYFEEVSDGRVDAGHADDGMVERAFG